MSSNRSHTQLNFFLHRSARLSQYSCGYINFAVAHVTPINLLKLRTSQLRLNDPEKDPQREDIATDGSAHPIGQQLLRSATEGAEGALGARDQQAVACTKRTVCFQLKLRCGNRRCLHRLCITTENFGLATPAGIPLHLDTVRAITKQLLHEDH